MARIAQLREREDSFREVGAEVILAFCQSRSAVRSWLAGRDLPFAVLVDQDRSIAKAWGVYVPLNFESIRIARPASFVVDAGGTVRFSHVGRHQLDRAPIGDLLEALQQAR